MNIRDTLNELNIPFKEPGSHHHVGQQWVGLDCPQCSPGSHRWRCGIHLRSLVTVCWTCGRLRLGDVLAGASGKPLSVVMPLVTTLSPRIDPDQQPRVPGRYTPPDGVGPLERTHRRYLERRGFDPDQLVETYRIGGISGGFPLQWRIFLPIFGSDNKSGSWTTRAVGNTDRRYVSAKPEQEARPIKSLLFGEQLVKSAVVVTEGLFGAMRIGPGGVAVMGVSTTPAQVARIGRFPVRAIAFDNDEPGRQRAQQLADDLAIYPGSTYVVHTSGPDPDTSPADEIAEIRSRFLD